jgi:hypothetical protein
MPNKHLAIYLNDHLAGATGALELLTHLETAHADTPVGDVLMQLHAEIEADRKELEHLIDRLDITVSGLRKAGAWLGEKLANIKLQLDDQSTGAMRLFEGLEVLAIGILGKRGLWRVLADASETLPELQGMDYRHLIQRAEDQHRHVEVLRLQAAKEAFETTD